MTKKTNNDSYVKSQFGDDKTVFKIRKKGVNNDSELVKQAQQGNRGSMDKLSQIAHQRLYTYLYRMTMNHDLTEDILQDTLLAMLQKVINLRKVSRFWPWLYRIAWSKVQQHYRTQYNRKMEYLADIEPAWQQVKLWDNRLEGLDGMIQQEKIDQLTSACNQLTPLHKDVVKLHSFEQLSYATIAQRTQYSCELLRLRFFRAKQRLKANLLSTGTV